MAAEHAAGAGSATAVGTVSARIASTPSSAPTCSRQRRNTSGATAAVVSTGPVTSAPGGSSRRSPSWTRLSSTATCRPASEQAPAASTPPPPALDTIATRPPAGTGWPASRAAASISSPISRVAMMPACPNSGPRVTMGVAAAAVCEAAARCAASERPASTVRTGMLAPTRRAVRPNLRGLPNDSRYSTASVVARSCSHHISRSLPDTSDLSPREANEEMPMPSRLNCSSSAMPTPPDCTARPAIPAAG
jgi:hypothetical protein